MPIKKLINYSAIAGASLCFTNVSAASIEASEIISFTPNSPAIAADVNANFNRLREGVNTNEQDITQHISDHDTDTIQAVKNAGVGDITDGLITKQFTIEEGRSNIIIPDFSAGGSATSSVSLRDIDVITELSVKVDISKPSGNDISDLTIRLTGPSLDGNTPSEYVLFNGNQSGTSLNWEWPANNAPVNGDLSEWIDRNPTGSWTLEVIDTRSNPGEPAGEITKWSITARGLSDSTATINGDLAVRGKLRIESNPLAPIQMSKMIFWRDNTNTIIYYAPDGTEQKLTIPDVNTPIGNDYIYYHPTGSNGSANATGNPSLFFNLTGASSIACTLLSNEDDVADASKSLYWATDGGNTGILRTAAWGTPSSPVDRPTFMLSIDQLDTAAARIPINTYAGYGIICF